MLSPYSRRTAFRQLEIVDLDLDRMVGAAVRAEDKEKGGKGREQREGQGAERRGASGEKGIKRSEVRRMNSPQGA